MAELQDDRPRAPLAFVDTETDGVHPGRQVYEVAIVRREPDGTEEAWERFVDIDLSTADPFGLRVGRFYDRHPKGRTLARYAASSSEPSAMRRDHAARRIAQLTHGAHLVGVNPSFDAEVLDHLLREHRLIPAWDYHLADIGPLALGYLAARGEVLLPPWSSDDLTARLGVDPSPPDERHTAMGDVRWAMRVWDRVMSDG